MHRNRRSSFGADWRSCEQIGLDLGAFAVVMATGIVSVAAELQRLTIFSDLLLGVACAGWIGIAMALSQGSPRSHWPRPRPQSFAVVAATAVIGARFTLAGESAVALALWSLATLLWFLLVCRLPNLGEATGGSLLGVVATESLAVAAALLAPHWTAAFLIVALAAWGLGLTTYPLVIVAIVRTLRRRRSFAPDLWIVMGALAITTLAGAELLLQARTMHALSELGQWLPDLDLATWSLASALIAPLLTAELRARSGWRYDPLRWSFVFPLGMYAVASHMLAEADALTPLNWIGDAFFLVSVTVWALTVLGLARQGRPLLRCS